MQKKDLYRWIENPDRLDTATLKELRTVVEEYPFFHTARLLYTKNLNLIDNQEYEDELGKTAVLCNDRRKLFYLIYRDEYGKFLNNNEGIRLERGDRTEELLESYLSSLGERDMIEPTIENAALNVATTDYFFYLKSLGGEIANSDQAEQQKLQHQDIIDAFIEKAESDILFVPKEAGLTETRLETEERQEEGEFLTETLAKIYIKQKKYEQALTIIKRLSLNFPKKSVYFAHQIRFLELLISIERSRQAK
ncbi:tetratricopeptide repeat protein [Proteiniphilum sp.]|uniref:tetratricopeptide repeat protein n=1 Tax=Proteiniphilum sp. TaxID=1926877 RepID=UPI002B20A81A|nr:tetratricopeptide repeat protein [Proteiniphilum sp.]MEA4917045.1 tetratricopeptide repeat protein [Proteiniphilum sp.]